MADNRMAAAPALAVMGRAEARGIASWIVEGAARIELPDFPITKRVMEGWIGSGYPAIRFTWNCDELMVAGQRFSVSALRGGLLGGRPKQLDLFGAAEMFGGAA